MIKNSLIILGLLLMSSVAVAKSYYIKDTLYVSMRAGPGNEYPVVKYLKTGDVLEFIEFSEDKQYIKLRTHDGVEGWLSEKYLTDTPVAMLQLTKMENRVTRLSSENTAMKTELKELRSKYSEMDTEARRLSKENERLRKENERMQEISSNPIAVANQNDELRNKNVALEKELSMKGQELQVLQDRSDREWFIIGAGVLAGGVVMGLLLPSFRRKGGKGNWSSL